MGWNEDKCTKNYPDNFSDKIAEELVKGANFRNSIFVGTSEKKRETRHAYTYVNWSGFRICVVGHIHLKSDACVEPGNSFIPGWENWSMPTPHEAVSVIASLPDKGNWGFWRYPERL